MSTRHRRCHLAALALSVGSLLLASCRQEPVPVVQPLKVAIDQWAGYYPLLIADEKHFLRDEHISVSVEMPQDTHRMIADFAAGEEDAICCSLGDIILTTRVQPDVRMILISDESSGGDEVLSRETIDRGASLKGKRIGTTLGGFGELLIRHCLQHYGVQPDEVVLVNADASAVPEMLKAGEIDIGHTWEPYAGQARQGGAKVIYSSLDTPGLILDGMVVHASTLREKPETIRGLERAWFRAVDWWKAHPAEGNKLIEDRLGYAHGSVNLDGVHLFDRNDNRKAFDPTLPDGTVYSATREYVDFFIGRGTLGRRLRPEEIVDGSLIP